MADEVFFPVTALQSGVEQQCVFYASDVLVGVFTTLTYILLFACARGALQVQAHSDGAVLLFAGARRVVLRGEKVALLAARQRHLFQPSYRVFVSSRACDLLIARGCLLLSGEVHRRVSLQDGTRIAQAQCAVAVGELSLRCLDQQSATEVAVACSFALQLSALTEVLQSAVAARQPFGGDRKTTHRTFEETFGGRGGFALASSGNATAGNALCKGTTYETGHRRAPSPFPALPTRSEEEDLDRLLARPKRVQKMPTQNLKPQREKSGFGPAGSQSVLDARPAQMQTPDVDGSSNEPLELSARHVARFSLPQASAQPDEVNEELQYTVQSPALKRRRHENFTQTERRTAAEDLQLGRESLAANSDCEPAAKERLLAQAKDFFAAGFWCYNARGKYVLLRFQLTFNALGLVCDGFLRPRVVQIADIMLGGPQPNGLVSFGFLDAHGRRLLFFGSALIVERVARFYTALYGAL